MREKYLEQTQKKGQVRTTVTRYDCLIHPTNQSELDLTEPG